MSAPPIGRARVKRVLDSAVKLPARDDGRPGGFAPAAATPEGFVTACRAVLLRELPHLVEDVFARVDDALYDLADKSTSNASYTVYFDAMRTLRRRRAEISARFLNSLEAEVAAGPEAAGNERGTLALMPEADLEESLAVANLISKAESRYRTELAELRGRLAALSGRSVIDARSDPLGPHVICNAFRAAMQPIEELEPALRLVVYKLFDRQVMDHLGEVYAHCLECSAAVGAPAASPPVGDGRAANLLRDESPEGGAATARAAEVRGRSEPIRLDNLRRLLARRLRARPANAQTVAQGELLFVLAGLQGREPPPEPVPLAPAALRQALRRELRLETEGPGARVLNAADEDILDLVFMLFEGILQGGDLPDRAKALISRLQIPVLKVALGDSTFFDDPRHPARCLLNHLAEAAGASGPDRDGPSNDAYRYISEVVERILRDFDRDPGIFRRLDAELVDRLEEERRRIDERTSAALEGLAVRERNRSAHGVIDAALQERLNAEDRVPEAVLALLQEGWRGVLLAAWLRSGADSEDWRRALAVVDRLLWSVRPKIGYEDRRELLRAIPDLLRTLREGLAAVSYDQRRLARLFKELQALHILALRGSAVPVRGPPAAPLPRATQRAPPAPEGLPPEVPEIPLGDWIEVEQEGGARLRLRLAGRTPGGVHLFVDRRGRQALELDGAQLAALLRTDRVRLVGEEGGALVDRAIDAMLQELGAS